jgi:hypothetical protein
LYGIPYTCINKSIKKYARREKRAGADKLAHKAQLAVETNNSRELYQITKRLAGKPLTSNQLGIRNATGRLLATPQNQLTRWQEYFKDNLAASYHQICMITTQTTPDTTKVSVGAPTKMTKIAIKHLKLNKASGPDNLSSEFFRTYPNTMPDILEPLLKKKPLALANSQLTGHTGSL